MFLVLCWALGENTRGAEYVVLELKDFISPLGNKVSDDVIGTLPGNVAGISLLCFRLLMVDIPTQPWRRGTFS